MYQLHISRAWLFGYVKGRGVILLHRLWERCRGIGYSLDGSCICSVVVVGMYLLHPPGSFEMNKQIFIPTYIFFSKPHKL